MTQDEIKVMEEAAIESAAKDRRGGTWTGDWSPITLEDQARSVELGYRRGFKAGYEKAMENKFCDLEKQNSDLSHDYAQLKFQLSESRARVAALEAALIKLRDGSKANWQFNWADQTARIALASSPSESLKAIREGMDALQRIRDSKDKCLGMIIADMGYKHFSEVTAQEALAALEKYFN